MTKAPSPVRLADLEESAGDVELLSGRVVRVRHLDAVGLELFASLSKGEGKEEDIWALGQRIMPDATPEEVRALTPEVVSAVAAIAAGKLAVVQAWLADLQARKAATPAPTVSSSSPAMESGTSSSASDAPSADSRASSLASHSISSSGISSS